MSREPNLPVTTVNAADGDIHCDLPSGRQVAIRVDGDNEQLVLVGRDGNVQLQVVMTDEGPVLKMPVARISLSGADELELAAKRVRLRSDEDFSIEAGGKLDIRSNGDTHVTAEENVRVVGSLIYLN